MLEPDPNAFFQAGPGGFAQEVLIAGTKGRGILRSQYLETEQFAGQAITLDVFRTEWPPLQQEQRVEVPETGETYRIAAIEPDPWGPLVQLRLKAYT